MWIIRVILIGLLSGYIGNRMMKNTSMSLTSYFILGTIGSFVGYILFGILGFRSVSFIGEVITAILGTCAFIYLKDYFDRS